jgi:hypothetical protein
VIRNNWHREQARDGFLITVDRASAFLSATKPIPFMDSDKADYLHIGNDPNREKSAKARKEKQMQQDPEARAREKEDRELLRLENDEMKADAALDRELHCLENDEMKADAALDRELLRLENDEMKADAALGIGSRTSSP